MTVKRDIHPEITKEQEFPKLYSQDALDDAVAKAVAEERKRCAAIAEQAGFQAFLDKRLTESPAIRAMLSAQDEIAKRIVTAIRKGK